MVNVGLGILDYNHVALLEVFVDFFCALALSHERVALLKCDQQVLCALCIEVSIDLERLVHALQGVDVVDNAPRRVVQCVKPVTRVRALLALLREVFLRARSLLHLSELKLIDGTRPALLDKLKLSYLWVLYCALAASPEGSSHSKTVFTAKFKVSWRQCIGFTLIQ